MKLLFIHPGPLLYTKVFLRLEPLGLEYVASAARRAGHEVKLIDLQVESLPALDRLVQGFTPDVAAISCNYLANVPEVVEIAKRLKALLPGCFVCVGGHSASFVAGAILGHAAGAIDCVLKGEGEAGIVPLLEAVESRADLTTVPGAVSARGEGPPPVFAQNLDDVLPARDLLRQRRKYFIGILDPAASIEFSRGCPWDCAFCSAWTFYGRSYRLVSPLRAVEDLRSVAEPGVFITDDVAFIQAEHGMAIGDAIASNGIQKCFYLETRGDVLLRNKEVFKFWTQLGLKYMFLGIEAIDEEGLAGFRKRISMGKNCEALEFARTLGIEVAVNIIADPDWDEKRFAAVRAWCAEVPEIVNISINTPYPGTESWLNEPRELTTLDYRLFDIQHAVLPTRLPLNVFYRELIHTQRVLYRKHLNWRNTPGAAREIARLLLRGQTNFLRGMLLWPRIFNEKRLLADHARPVTYAMPARTGPITRSAGAGRGADLYVHAPPARKKMTDKGTHALASRGR